MSRAFPGTATYVWNIPNVRYAESGAKYSILVATDANYGDPNNVVEGRVCTISPYGTSSKFALLYDAGRPVFS